MPAFGPIGTMTWGDNVEQLSTGSVTVTEQGSGFYYEMMVAAAEMLAEFNTGSVIIYQESETPHGNDIFNPNIVNDSPLTRNAVVLGYSDDRVDGVNIKSDDLRVFLDARSLGFKPTQTNRLDIDTKTHSIVSVKPVPAAGLTCLWILQARIMN